MSKKQPASMSKRQVLKEQRLKRQRQQRLTMILGISVVALVLAGFLIYPSIKEARTPVGDIINITPSPRPMAQGTAAGDPNAPVKIEIFEDFQCPSCRIFTETVEPQLIQDYIATGKVYYVFRQYPFLDDKAPTKESHQAANASMCAADQNRFWDYHDILFTNWNGENQGSFTDKRLVAFAETLGLDMNSFNSCFKANKFNNKIQEDLAAGKSMGVTGTPSVFVDGKIVSQGLIPTYDDMKNAIETALASSGN